MTRRETSPPKEARQPASADRHLPSMTPEGAAIFTSKLLETCRASIMCYFVVAEEQAVIMATWILHTYVFEAAEFTPYALIFLGLPLRSNHEPPRGYYFANQVLKHFQLGAAKREVESLLANGAHLKIVAARDKASGRPIRFTTYKPHQIQIEGNLVVCRNDKRSIRLSSNWSTETALQRVAEALRTGTHYGYDPARDDGPTPRAEHGYFFREITACYRHDNSVIIAK
jgi:hypothetical protein